jgi:hypothetical protein
MRYSVDPNERTMMHLRNALLDVVKSYATLGVEQKTWALLSVAAEEIASLTEEEQRNELIGKCGLLLVNASLRLRDDYMFDNDED